MKRDMELVREILLWMEIQPEGHNVNWDIKIDGYSDEQIAYHIYLMSQAGLIYAQESTFLESHSPQAIPISITWEGHEFIGAAKDRHLWDAAKSKVIGPAGTVAFTVLLEWLKVQALKKLGIT